MTESRSVSPHVTMSSEQPEAARPEAKKSKSRRSTRSKLDEPVAPDGGWGWVILFASFLSAVIVDGVCFSFGIFYLEFLDYYQENKGKTAWVGSVLNGTYMIMGPIAAALAKRFGCRAVAIGGSIWAAMAFILATFSPTVDILILTYGVLGGMGFGFIYLPSIVIVQYYFDKKRAFATGVSTCGSGIGAIIFAPLSKYLIDQYGWKGAQWIIAAIALNGMVLGCVYRPLNFRELERIRRRWQRKQERQERRKLEIEIENTKLAIESRQSMHSIQVDDNENDIKYEEDIRSPTPQMNGHTVTNSVLSIQSGYSYDFSIKEAANNVRRRKNVSVSENSYIGGSYHSLGMSGILASASMENLSTTQVSDDTDHDGDDLADVFKDLFRGIKETMDFSMLKSPVFVIYGFSCIFSMAGFFVPFTYLPARAIGLGYGASKGAFLLSCLGIANTVGRVLAGWASDRPWADCLVINNMALIIGGLATVAAPHMDAYWLLVAYALVFGTCIAAFVTLRSIILVDLIGLDKLASAFGLVVLCQGISSFVGSPLAGTLFDTTGTYHMSFYVAGGFITLSGLICIPLRKMAAWQREMERKRSTQHMQDTELQEVPLTSV